jgi:hypothetical protein
MLPCQFKINQVFESLVKEIGLLQTREIISAWYGTKVTRIGIKPKLVRQVTKTLDRLELHYYVSPELVFLKRDIGKGGWSNKFEERDCGKKKFGDHIVYISNHKGTLQDAVKSDSNGEDDEFGLNLGIPDCCIQFYIDNREKAYLKQNDFVPLVYRNTEDLHSFNFWNNYVAQYFGYSFLSHFPCSFNCPESAKISKEVYNQLKAVLPNHAEKIIHFQKQPVLYTEYTGIYLFENAITDNQSTMIENCIIHSTLQKKAKTLNYISHLNRIEIIDKDKICFYSITGDSKIISNSNYAMCTFGYNE